MEIKMQSYDLEKILQSKSEMPVDGTRSGHFWEMNPFEGGTTWVGKWSGESPWEKHAAGDEFIHVLKGTVEIEIITEDGKKSVVVPEGSIFVVPKDHWHKQIAWGEVTVLGATPGVTDHSDVEPPAARRMGIY
jgi:quercetin dioxygenase-like cupin family protein